MNPAVLLRSGSFGRLKRFVLERTGLSYYAERDEDLAARISRRLSARAIGDPASYMGLLERDPDEIDCLVGELTIGETYFFRQGEQFDLLRRTIVPDILERKRSSRQVRIWSAGCATGAEPYSIAILLRLEFAEQLAGWDVSIIASDINVEFLAQAREGVFGDWALRETPPEIKARCFSKESKRWRLLPEFARSVDFQYYNLVAEQPPPAAGRPFDIIFCRNVLIYFSQRTIRDIAGKFFDTLDEGGWLVVGHAEPNQETFAMFDTWVDAKSSAYRKSAHTAISRPYGLAMPGFAYPPVALPVVDWPAVVKADPPSGSGAIAKDAVKQRPSTLPVEEVRKLADLGCWDQAREAADHLVREEPLNASAQFTLGLIQEHAGDHEAARQALRRAIYLDRSFALAHYHLATLLQTSGDRHSAGRCFATVLRLVNNKPSSEPVPQGDGITAGELGDLAKMHLELLGQ